MNYAHSPEGWMNVEDFSSGEEAQHMLSEHQVARATACIACTACRRILGSMAVSQGLDERAGTQKTRRLLKPHVARKNSRYTGLAGKEKGDAELRRSSEVQHSQDQRRAARMLAFGHQD
eukprot:s1385_g20.t1